MWANPAYFTFNIMNDIHMIRCHYSGFFIIIIICIAGANMEGWCLTDVCLSQTILSDKKFINFQASGAWCATYFLSGFFLKWMWTQSCLINQCLSCIQPFTVISSVIGLFVLSCSCLPPLYQIWNPPCLWNCNCTSPYPWISSSRNHPCPWNSKSHLWYS